MTTFYFCLSDFSSFRAPLVGLTFAPPRAPEPSLYVTVLSTKPFWVTAATSSTNQRQNKGSPHNSWCSNFEFGDWAQNLPAYHQGRALGLPLLASLLSGLGSSQAFGYCVNALDFENTFNTQQFYCSGNGIVLLTFLAYSFLGAFHLTDLPQISQSPQGYF